MEVAKPPVKSLMRCLPNTTVTQKKSRLKCCTGGQDDAPKKSFAHCGCRHLKWTQNLRICQAMTLQKVHIRKAASRSRPAAWGQKMDSKQSSTSCFAGTKKLLKKHKPQFHNTYSIKHGGELKNDAPASRGREMPQS